MKVKKFFTDQQQADILAAIREAEKGTSGEIRLHLESGCKGDPLSRAIQVFQKLKMQKTALRNGTLIYLAIDDHKFAIFGDEGINKIVPENFWEDVKEGMRLQFSAHHFAEGITEGVRRVGEKLKEYFPYQKDDINELSDEISMGS
jgi:uncharacterized membrane protein